MVTEIGYWLGSFWFVWVLLVVCLYCWLGLLDGCFVFGGLIMWWLFG